MKVLVTGATGFIGKALVERLAATAGMSVVAAGRGSHIHRLPNAKPIQVGDLNEEKGWEEALIGVDVVIHAAARAHIMPRLGQDSLAEYRKVNVLGTRKLAHLAAASGTRRFIFISSIKVNGELTGPGKAFSADDQPAPVDSYGISKKEAEDELRAVGKQMGMEGVVIRPPLVYGPGVKANYLSMMRWAWRRLPWPKGDTSNRRSLVALDNLLDLIIVCIDHPAAAEEIFLASDNEDLSTSELFRRQATVLGKPPRLINLPKSLTKLGASAIGKRELGDRLYESLQVDITKTQELLGWTPRLSVDEGLKRVAEYFLTLVIKP